MRGQRNAECRTQNEECGSSAASRASFDSKSKQAECGMRNFDGLHQIVTAGRPRPEKNRDDEGVASARKHGTKIMR